VDAGVALKVFIQTLGAKVLNIELLCHRVIHFEATHVVGENQQAARIQSLHTQVDEQGVITLNVQHIVGTF
jgi:hypothetical protein